MTAHPTGEPDQVLAWLSEQFDGKALHKAVAERLAADCPMGTGPNRLAAVALAAARDHLRALREP